MRIKRRRHAEISNKHLANCAFPISIHSTDQHSGADAPRAKRLKSEFCLPAEPSAVRKTERKKKERKKTQSEKHATCNIIYTYKLNVAYFIIPKAFWYSEPPCTTSTICHLEIVVSRLSEMPVSVSRYRDHYRADYWAACSQILSTVAIYGYWTRNRRESWNAIFFSLLPFFF